MIGIYDIERINSENGTLQIARSNNNRETRCGFLTRDVVKEWDEIIVEDDLHERLFGGILDSPSIDFTDNMEQFGVSSAGYQKIFDRKKVEGAWEEMSAGDILRDIVETYCPDFSTEGIEDGPDVSRVVFNYVNPSEAVKRICDATGYRWYIDAYKVVHYVSNDSELSPISITEDGSFWKNLQINVDISNLVNVVILRGGTYLSEDVDYYEVADGVKTQFVLPEKPHDIQVFVNDVEKTVGIKFGQEDAVEDFQVNFNEKYIENGTLPVLAEGDELHVIYKYDVPIRVRVKNLASISAMAALFPETDGMFEKVIQDKSIDSRSLAYNIASQNLSKWGTALVSGSFSTVEDYFEPGQIIRITKGTFSGKAVIQRINSKQVAGGFWKHTVNFATVLFGFEEFMRDLYAARKVELIDGETLETSTEVDDTISITEIVTVSIDLHRTAEQIDIEDEVYSDLNAGIEYVLGPYFPSDFTDTKRQFILDGSPLS